MDKPEKEGQRRRILPCPGKTDEEIKKATPPQEVAISQLLELLSNRGRHFRFRKNPLAVSPGLLRL